MPIGVSTKHGGDVKHFSPSAPVYLCMSCASTSLYRGERFYSTCIGTGKSEPLQPMAFLE
jgi:hypothetical protein